VFQKKTTPTSRATTDTVAGSTFSVLGADLAVKGDMTASADLHIDGRIEGDITCAALVQGETSEIIGAVRAESARLSGIVRGTVHGGSVVILRSARIHGDVHYDTLSVEQGAVVEGRFAQQSSERLGQEA